MSSTDHPQYTLGVVVQYLAMHRSSEQHRHMRLMMAVRNASLARSQRRDNHMHILMRVSKCISYQHVHVSRHSFNLV